MFEIAFRDSSLYPKQLSLFCLLWMISVNFSKTLVWEYDVNYDVTNNRHKIQMTSCATECNPPLINIFCVRHWLLHAEGDYQRML